MTEPKFTNVTPNGLRLEYFEKPWGRGTRRWYEINGERVPSVTEVLGIIDDGKAGGMAWSAARIWLDGVCELLLDDGLHDEHFAYVPEEIEKHLKSRKLLHTDKWGDKADLGTAVHSALEDLCAGTIPSLTAYSAEQQPYVRGVCEWFADNDPNVIHTELLVGSDRGYAGRFDLCYERNGQTVIADLKTSKAVRPTYHLQLAAYWHAFEECGYGTVDRCEVIWVKPDGGYEVIESKAKPEQFWKVLDAHKAFHEVKQEAKAA